jgi:hypothetical protein
VPLAPGSEYERYTTRFSPKRGSSATSSRPPWPRATTCGTLPRGSDTRPSRSTRRSRPGRSVTSIRPSGRKARPHGCSRPWATGSARITPFVGAGVGERGAWACAWRTGRGVTRQATTTTVSEALSDISVSFEFVSRESFAAGGASSPDPAPVASWKVGCESRIPAPPRSLATAIPFGNQEDGALRNARMRQRDGTETLCRAAPGPGRRGPRGVVRWRGSGGYVADRHGAGSARRFGDGKRCLLRRDWRDWPCSCCYRLKQLKQPVAEAPEAKAQRRAPARSRGPGEGDADALGRS